MPSSFSSGTIRTEDRGASGGSLIIVGLLVFVATALLAVLGESGDCGGTRSDCEALFVAGAVRARVLAGFVVGLAGLCALAWYARRWTVHAMLLLVASLILGLGVASFVVHAGMPAWVPNLVGFTVPGSLLIVLGAYRRLRGTLAR